jgi:PAS domain S-box-containing protein
MVTEPRTTDSQPALPANGGKHPPVNPTIPLSGIPVYSQGVSIANLKLRRYPPSVPGVALKIARDHISSDERLESLRRTQQELKQARDYAQAIVESLPPLLVLDPRLRVGSANRSFYQHFRVSPLQTENCLLYRLGDGQWNIPNLRTHLEKVLPRYSAFNDFEVTREFAAIGRRTLLLSGRQVDHLQRILLFIRDITERRESHAALRTSEIRYRRLFEAARDGILILDPRTRRITDANPFMSELLGYPRKELLGKELWEIGLLKDEQANRAAFRELQKKHYIRYENLPLQNQKGHRHEVEFVSNLYDEDGQKVIQCNIRDITTRKRAERALSDAMEEIGRHALELERVVRERTGELRATIGELEGFSNSVSHDMRAPLRAMQSFAQYLVDEYGSKLDEQGVNYLHQIMRSAVRLDRLIQDVLSYTRILHAKLPMDRVDLDRLVRDIVETFPNGQPIKPEIRIKGRLPQVIGNEALLAQCVSNLLSNGAKFVSPGTTPRLEVSAQAVGTASTRVWFKDNGIGIAPKNHDRIFRLFERIHPATEYDGTGIGLTIVRKAAERMDAQVGFDSKLGKRSHFWIQLKKG